MSEIQYLVTPQGRRLAFHRTEGRGPGIVFLGGFKSDMEGTKATWLESWCSDEDRAFLRFDYSGHGASEGAFEDGAIGDWADDAEAAISMLTSGPQVLIGSSMGGWISLLMSKRIPDRIAALVTIAAAPDFTEDSYWASFSDAQRHEVMTEGSIAVPSDYGEPYIITRRLIENGRENFVLRDPLELPFPVRFLQGTEDAAVPLDRATTLLGHAQGDDMRLVVLKGGDHSFSSPDALRLIQDATRNALAAVAAT